MLEEKVIEETEIEAELDYKPYHCIEAGFYHHGNDSGAARPLADERSAERDQQRERGFLDDRR